jgi:hypothetical protein
MAKVRIIILFALSFAGCLSIVDPNRKYKAHLQAAERAYSKADYAEAENEYRLAIDIAKHSPEEHKQFIALRGLAQVYASANRDLEAEAVFVSALSSAKNC